MDNSDSSGHYLFAAPGFRSPLEGLTNLVSLHIEENVPNVTPEHLQALSLLRCLSELKMHVAFYKPATRSTQKGGALESSMTSAVYRALSSLPSLSSLSVDAPSDHLTKLTGLQSLSFTRCHVDWNIHMDFSRLTQLTEVYVGHGRLTLHEVQNLQWLVKATFSIDAVDWDFLRGLTTVRNLTLRRCRLSNVAFDCLTSLTQLTSLDFSIRYPINGGIDYDCLDNHSKLTCLASLHGRFASRYRHESPQDLSMWVSKLPSLTAVPEQELELKLHQVPRYSDCMSDFDGSVSCVSGDDCENCTSLLRDLDAFNIDSDTDSEDHYMY